MTVGPQHWTLEYSLLCHFSTHSKQEARRVICPQLHPLHLNRIIASATKHGERMNGPLVAKRASCSCLGNVDPLAPGVLDL